MACGSPSPEHSSWLARPVASQDGLAQDAATGAGRELHESFLTDLVEHLQHLRHTPVQQPSRRRLDDGEESSELAAGSQLIWHAPYDLSLTVVVAIGMLIPLVSLVSSRRLGKKLWRVGAALTGSATVDTPTLNAVVLLAGVPKLALTAMVCLAIPECVPLWMFLGSIITSQNFLSLPSYLFELAGGRTSVVLQLSKAEDHDRAPVKMYPCGKLRRPTVEDLRLARGFILAFAYVLPLLTLCELLFEYQFLLGAEFAEDALNVLGTLNVLKVPFTVMCVLGCRALVTIIGYANAAFQRSADDFQVKWVLSYCQRYVVFISGVPNLVRMVLIFNVDLPSGEYVPSKAVSNIGCALTLCLGTAVCARVAHKAFIVQEGAIRDEGSMRLLAMRFCPLCGHEGLDLEQKQRRGLCGSVACQQCGAAGFPDHICIRQTPEAQPDTVSGHGDGP